MKLRAEKFLRDLEQAMMLVIFKPDTEIDKLPESLKSLVDYSNRYRLASQVNSAILNTMGYQSDHKLGYYWQMCQWSQKELQAKAL